MSAASAAHPARYGVALGAGRVRCELCPRRCTLAEGQRGFCFVRANEGGRLVLTTYGRSSGFCIDPIEKKPLNHFHPGTAVLSFGTAGCNLGCKFCQNWDISKSREFDRLTDAASPEALADTAVAWGAASVAFTYNDPVIFAEYAIDVAEACRARGVWNVAVTAGYVNAEARRDFFATMDAANVDLKAFSDDFYRRVTGGRLAPVLETLRYLRHDTDVWLELTTLLIPGLNDSDAEVAALCGWVAAELGPDVPLHFSAFHPDHRMREIARTPASTLRRARTIGLDAGLRYVYMGNVHDAAGDTTLCACGAALIERDWYDLLAYRLDEAGRCRACGTPLPGRFDARPGSFGARRIPIRIAG